ncbi:MAG: hypothetical protein LBH08_02465 [Puniceicoccales bacterium]|jgi:hypothetical protein|nr:hypothetical protein [Puniceicoccales bacterium]
MLSLVFLRNLLLNPPSVTLGSNLQHITDKPQELYLSSEASLKMLTFSNN